MPIASLASWAGRNRLALAIGIGVGLRLVEYAHGRSFWLDEGSLVDGILVSTPSALFGPLRNSQLAPPGFLVAEWSAMRALGATHQAFRLVPLLAGVASMLLVAAVARRVLAPGSAWLAVALFAVTGDLIYFAAEAKQYSSDVAAALACWLLGLSIGSRPLTTRSAATLAMLGGTVVWFSHPSIFVLAAVGTVGLTRAAQARDGRSALAWVLVGLAWVASFAGVHAVAMNQLGHSRGMWAFWAFAFPPMPPRSIWDATWSLRRFALLLANPLSYHGPIAPGLSILPAFGLALVGAGRIGRRSPDRLAILLLPGLFAMAAAHLKLYPFHGRLLLFFTPALLLLIAYGLDFSGKPRGWGWTILHSLLIAIVLGLPAASAAYHLIEPPRRDFFNPFGDLRPTTIEPGRFPF